MDHSVPIACLQILVGGVIGWSVRQALEPEANTCNCSCVCRCSCELGLTPGTWLVVVLLLVVIGFFVLRWLDKIPKETPRVTGAGVKGQKGAFGTLGKLPLTG